MSVCLVIVITGQTQGQEKDYEALIDINRKDAVSYLQAAAKKAPEYEKYFDEAQKTLLKMSANGTPIQRYILSEEAQSVGRSAANIETRIDVPAWIFKNEVRTALLIIKIHTERTQQPALRWGKDAPTELKLAHAELVALKKPTIETLHKHIRSNLTTYGEATKKIGAFFTEEDTQAEINRWSGIFERSARHHAAQVERTPAAYATKAFP